MRRTKQESAATRETILNVAERLFLERGVADVSLEQIALAAGFTRGAVHWHFQNKQGLLIALFDRMGAPIEHLAGKLAVDERLDPLDELLSELTQALSELQIDQQRKRLTTTLLLFALVEAPERQLEFERKLRDLFADIFRLAEKRDLLAPHWPPRIAALAFCGMIGGMINQWLIGETDFDLRTDATAAVRAFVTSLKAR